MSTLSVAEKRLEAIRIANKNKGFIELSYGQFPIRQDMRKLLRWLNTFVIFMSNEMIEPEDYLLRDWYPELAANGVVMVYSQAPKNENVYQYHKAPFEVL